MIKTYVINLERDTIKKQHIIDECQKQNIVPTFINAVDGKALSLEFIQQHVYDYPNCALTLGEIGCALSHLEVYKNMAAENIKWALVLEDDAYFVSDVHPVFEKIKELDNINIPTMYQLGKASDYLNKKYLNLGDNTLHVMLNGSCTHGYIINLAAAKRLLQIQNPIMFESDRFGIFNHFFNIRTYCIVPIVIDTLDHDKSNSSLERERKTLITKRNKFVQKIKHKYLIKYIKYVLWKIFIKPFLSIVKD